MLGGVGRRKPRPLPDGPLTADPCGHGVPRSCEVNPPSWMSLGSTRLCRAGDQAGGCCRRVRELGCGGRTAAGALLTDSPHKLPSSPPGLSGQGAPCLHDGAFEFKSLCPFRKTSPGSSTSPVPSATQATGTSSPSGLSAASPACTPKVPSLATLERGAYGCLAGGWRAQASCGDAE